MKFGIFFLLIASFALNGSAQKMMMLNENLKANSEPLSVKMRGGSMMKFDFGVYKTISAKAGLTRTSSSSKFFSSVEKSESKQKSSME